MGSGPELVSRRLVRFTADSAPHFANLGGPSSAPKTLINDDKGEQ